MSRQPGNTRLSQLARLSSALLEAISSGDPTTIESELADAKAELEADPKFGDFTSFMSFVNWAELEGEQGAATLAGVLVALKQQCYGLSFLNVL